MALPSAGSSISLQQVNVELGNTGTDAINMGSSAVRTLFDDASGAISMSDGFGKSNELGLTASAASSANLKTLFDNNTAGSWAGSTSKRYTIGASTTMGIITAPASMGGTLTIDLAGNIQGVAGSANGGAGGTAMTVQSTGITINMASGSTISGGGGGGGQGGTGANFTFYTCSSDSWKQSCAVVGQCEGGDSNVFLCTYYGGGGGAGGIGQGYGQSAANGSGGGGGSHHLAGVGGTGGNGGAFGAAGANGATGANSYTHSGSGGSSGGAAGRAITFSGVSAYDIIGTDNGTINGAYN